MHSCQPCSLDSVTPFLQRHFQWFPTANRILAFRALCALVQTSPHIPWASLAPKHQSGPCAQRCHIHFFACAVFLALNVHPCSLLVRSYISLRPRSNTTLSHEASIPLPARTKVYSGIQHITRALFLFFVLTLAGVIYKLVSPLNHMLLKTKTFLFLCPPHHLI